MRKLFITLGVISSIIAVILAVLPLSKLALIPAIIAFVCGLLAFFKSKPEGSSKHTVQLIFLLTIISLSLATYKAIFDTIEVGDTEQLEQRDKESKEKALQELEELDIEISE